MPDDSSFSDAVIDVVADFACHTGEGPVYEPDSDLVYWTDIPEGAVYWYDDQTGDQDRCFFGHPVGGMTLQSDAYLLLFQAKGELRILRADGGQVEVIREIPEERETRFNDVWADPEGRVFCGTMPTKDRPGRLYRIDPDLSLHLILEGIGCSNGIGLSPDGQYLYYTDTSRNEIYRFRYDRATGNIHDREVFITVPREPGEGYPDGMTVDAEGCIWSARWDGGCIVRYDPNGVEMGRLPLPGVRKVSSVLFGGPKYDILWVTTAGGNRKDQDGPNAGALFRIKIPGIRGVPEFRSRIYPKN